MRPSIVTVEASAGSPPPDLCRDMEIQLKTGLVHMAPATTKLVGHRNSGAYRNYGERLYVEGRLDAMRREQEVCALAAGVHCSWLDNGKFGRVVFSVARWASCRSEHDWAGANSKLSPVQVKRQCMQLALFAPVLASQTTFPPCCLCSAGQAAEGGGGPR